MERSVALRKLTKLLGKKFHYRVDLDAPTAEEREVQRATYKVAAEERSAIERRMNERQRALLAADVEYQSILADYRASRLRCQDLSKRLHGSKFTVGTVSDLGGFGAFHVAAEGDSWEQVIEKLKAKK